MKKIFELSDIELERAKEFIDRQRSKENSKLVAIGGRFTYSFTPTGIGTGIEIIDNQLDEKEDITEHEKW